MTLHAAAAGRRTQALYTMLLSDYKRAQDAFITFQLQEKLAAQTSESVNNAAGSSSKRRRTAQSG